MDAKTLIKFLKDNNLNCKDFSKITKISEEVVSQWLTKKYPLWLNTLIHSEQFKEKLKKFQNKPSKKIAARIYIEDGWKMIPSYEKSIAHTHPILTKEWDSEKNGVLRPEHFTKGSHHNVWWKCQNGHSFQKPIRERLKATLIKCPICSHTNIEIPNNITITYPSLLKDWDYEKNVLSPTQISPKSDRKVHWKCRFCKKEWESTLSNRTSRSSDVGGCTTCTNRRRNVDPEKTFAVLYPEIAAEWHPTLNKELHITPEELAPSSNLKVWWKCLKNGHEWKSVIQSRTNRSSECPHCTNYYRTNTYDLKVSPIEIINFLFSNDISKTRLSTLLHVRSSRLSEWLNEEHLIPDQIRNKLNELQQILNSEK